MPNIFLFSAGSIFLYMISWFLLAQLKKDNSIVDVAWGLGFVLLAILTFALYSARLQGQYILLFMISIWGIRLASHIHLRAIGKEEDWRYQNMRKRWGDKYLLKSFLYVFMLQGFLLYLVAVPIILVNASTTPTEIGVLEILGAAIWLFGFLWESISDYQLYKFKKNGANKGKLMTTGLWAYSRHPNYFGEIVLWWGIFLFSLPYTSWYFSLISPILITWLLTRVSGVPLLERKYKGNEAYEAYKKKTGALIPKF